MTRYKKIVITIIVFLVLFYIGLFITIINNIFDWNILPLLKLILLFFVGLSISLIYNKIINKLFGRKNKKTDTSPAFTEKEKVVPDKNRNTREDQKENKESELLLDDDGYERY